MGNFWDKVKLKIIRRQIQQTKKANREMKAFVEGRGNLITVGQMKIDCITNHADLEDRVIKRQEAMKMGKKIKTLRTLIRIDRMSPDGRKRHYKSITLGHKPEKVWKAISNGCYDVLKEDIDTLRAKRKRKGRGR